MFSSDNARPLLPEQRSHSCESTSSRRKSSVEYCHVTGAASIVTDEELASPSEVLAKKVTFYQWASKWSEDGCGLLIGLVVFAFIVILSFNHQDVADYSRTVQWPLGLFGFGFFVVFMTQYMLKKAQALESYGAIIMIAIVARAIGEYEVLKESGLSASFWAIIIGILFRYLGLECTNKAVVSGEFFIKIGVILMAMDVSSIESTGLPGIVVAWVDTFIVLAIGIVLGVYLLQMPAKDCLVVSGATTICGSSAATAISASIHEEKPDAPPFVDNACRTVIALMGILNTPLMPLMPLAYLRGGVNPNVVGAWIGGSIDSAGQVVGSASLGGDAVLETATIIKMAQIMLIGPICLALTVYYQGSFKPSILADKFPLFVMGFLITSTVVNIVKSMSSVDDNVGDLLSSNAWFVSEWINLVGFARLGLQIDIKSFAKNADDRNVIMLYLMLQTIDLTTTFGWSYLMFQGSSYEDDDI